MRRLVSASKYLRLWVWLSGVACGRFSHGWVRADRAAILNAGVFERSSPGRAPLALFAVCFGDDVAFGWRIGQGGPVLFLPLLRELRPGPDLGRRIGLVALWHDGDSCALDVTDCGSNDEPGDFESWVLRDAVTGEQFPTMGGGGGGGTGESGRSRSRFRWLFECRTLPTVLGVRTMSGSVDEVVALDSVGRASSTRRRFVHTTPEPLSRDELEALTTPGPFRDSLPVSIEMLDAEPFTAGRVRLEPTVIETWRGGEKAWFRITEHSEDMFGPPENDDPRSDLGIKLVDPDGVTRRGTWSGHSGADGAWLSITYPGAAF